SLRPRQPAPARAPSRAGGSLHARMSNRRETMTENGATTVAEPVPARSRGRAARLVQRGARAPHRPYIHRRIGTFNILDEEGLSLIEANADRLLKEIGMEFHDDPEILDIFREAGADVQGTRVRFEPGMCRRIVRATAPSQFKQHARNPANTVVIGGDNTVLCPSWGPPFVHDLDRGRRYATIDD